MEPKIHLIIDMDEQTKQLDDVLVTAFFMGLGHGFVGGTERFVRITGTLDYAEQIEAFKSFLTSPGYSPSQAGDTDDDI
jgi:hypothetical protein